MFYNGTHMRNTWHRIGKQFENIGKAARGRRATLVNVGVLLALVAVIGIGAKAYGEQAGSSPSNGSTSRIKSLYTTLQGNSYGSDTDTPDWGTYWNRIKTSAAWVPSGSLAAGDVVNGKTFYNGSRTQQTGTLSFTGTATAADVLNGKTFYGNSTTQQTGTADLQTPVGNCPTQQYYDGYSALATQTTNCTASITWTTPADGITGTDKRDPLSGLIWSQALLLNGSTPTFSVSSITSWTWDASGANNVTAGSKTAKQLCTDRGNGWRLPTQKELMQAYINGSYFNLTQPSNYFWSATQNSSTNAWYVSLRTGFTYYNIMTNSNYVRCVR